MNGIKHNDILCVTGIIAAISLLCFVSSSFSMAGELSGETVFLADSTVVAGEDTLRVAEIRENEYTMFPDYMNVPESALDLMNKRWDAIMGIGLGGNLGGTNMHGVNENIRKYVESVIIPKYDGFDKAHGRDHVIRVIEESLELAGHYDVDADMVYVIAAYHDLGLCAGREFHHIESGRIISADKVLRQWFDEFRIDVMARAVEDHRASSAHEPRTIYGKIVAEADRIIDPEITLRRTVQYGMDHYPEMSREEHYRRFHAHLMEKYAEGGYLRLWIPESANHARLEQLRKMIGDEETLRRTFDELYGGIV